MHLPLNLQWKWKWLLLLAALAMPPATLVSYAAGLPSAQAQAQEIADAAQQAEADRLLDLGLEQYEAGQLQEALQSLQAAQALYQTLGDRASEASTLNNIGLIYWLQGSYAEALSRYQQSLTMHRELGNRAGEADTLHNIGNIYALQGSYAEALSLYQQSLSTSRELGDRAGEADVLLGIGAVYQLQGSYAEALSRYQQSLTLSRELGNRAGEASTLNNIGLIYWLQGSYAEALSRYQQSLTMHRELGNRAGEANTLNNIGNIYQLQGNDAEALATYQQSLTISRELGDRAVEGQTLNNISALYQNQGNYEAALTTYEQSLVISQELGNRTVEASTLNNIGLIYRLQGSYAEALSLYQQSLTISRELGDRASEADTLGNIGLLWNTQGATALAIVFLKESVNVYEDIRQSNQSLEQSLKDSYITTIEGTYRFLADLLLDQGRIMEAQQVLELLKAEELRQFTRASFSGGTLTYDPAEQPVVESHGSLIALGSAIAACDPHCDQPLYDQQMALQRQFNQTVSSFEQTVRQGRANDRVFYDPANLSSDALDLVNAQPGTVLIYPVVLADRLWLLWTATGGVVGSVEVSVSQAELSRAAVRFRELLERQDAQAYNEFKAVSQQLHGWLMAPMQAELEKNNIRHLIFAQDRTTRYLPMAALYDGNQYLLERYTISTVLSAALTDTQGRLGAAESVSALGLGLTQAIPGFSPLPNVGEELRATIRAVDNPDRGIFPGQIFLDEAFTFEALSQNVRRANILHIATHAEFVPSTQGESYILSGTGQRLALSDIGALDAQFRNLHLVVLSACQTALGGAALDGTEIAGVSSYFLGRNKAKTVIATLWKVDDAGTSLLMQRFYALLATGQLTQAEALRQAQLSLLKGDTSLDDRMANLGVRRGFELAAPEAASAGLAHPYYWAPFILIGNPL